MSSTIDATIRKALPEDMSRIRECLAEMNAKVDQPFTGLPELKRDDEGNYKKPPYLFEMWVVEIEGEIRGAFYLEKAAEFCQVGLDPRVTAAIKAFAPQAINPLQDMGLRVIHTAVPKEFPDVWKILADMDFFRTGYEHFTIRLG